MDASTIGIGVCCSHVPLNYLSGSWTVVRGRLHLHTHLHYYTGHSMLRVQSAFAQQNTPSSHAPRKNQRNSTNKLQREDTIETKSQHSNSIHHTKQPRTARERGKFRTAMQGECAARVQHGDTPTAAARSAYYRRSIRWQQFVIF